MKRTVLTAGIAALALAAAIGSGTASGASDAGAQLKAWYKDAFSQKAGSLRWGREEPAGESIRASAAGLVQEQTQQSAEQLKAFADLAGQQASDALRARSQSYSRQIDEAAAELRGIQGVEGAIQKKFRDAAQARTVEAETGLEQALEQTLDQWLNQQTSGEESP